MSAASTPRPVETRRMIEMMSGEVLTADDLAEILKVSRSTIVRRFKDGTIPAKRIGTKWRCSRSVVDKFFQTA